MLSVGRQMNNPVFFQRDQIPFMDIITFQRCLEHRRTCEYPTLRQHRYVSLGRTTSTERKSSTLSYSTSNETRIRCCTRKRRAFSQQRMSSEISCLSKSTSSASLPKMPLAGVWPAHLSTVSLANQVRAFDCFFIFIFLMFMKKYLILLD